MNGGGTHPTHKLLSTPTSICFGEPTKEMAFKSSKSSLSCPPAHPAPQMMEGKSSLCRGLPPNSHKEPGHCWQQAGGAGWVHMHPNCCHCHLIPCRTPLQPLLHRAGGSQIN